MDGEKSVQHQVTCAAWGNNFILENPVCSPGAPWLVNLQSSSHSPQVLPFWFDGVDFCNEEINSWGWASSGHGSGLWPLWRKKAVGILPEQHVDGECEPWRWWQQQEMWYKPHPRGSAGGRAGGSRKHGPGAPIILQSSETIQVHTWAAGGATDSIPRNSELKSTSMAFTRPIHQSSGLLFAPLTSLYPS